MFQRELKKIFILITLFATIFLIYNLYESYKFKNTPISKEIKFKIDKKEREVIAVIKKHYKINFKVPIIISNKINSKLYGVTFYDGFKDIKIVLNKKRLKENLNYILNDVIAHEYAHALMFRFGKHSRGDGHSKEWQNVCKKLGGSRCDRYANTHDILREKVGF